MAIPVITTASTTIRAVVGESLGSLALSATGSPDVWDADALPSGITLNAATGILSGTYSAGGVTESEITAQNADGTSSPITITWIISTAAVGVGAWSDLVLDFDLDTRQVTAPGLPVGANGEIFSIARGDSIDLLVGFKTYGVLQDLGSTVTVRIALREEAEGLNLELAGGTATKVGSNDLTRYRIHIPITQDNWAVLSDYENDNGTRLGAPTQIEVAVGSTFREASDTFAVEVMQDMTPD